MDHSDVNALPSFLGIQISNGDVIPINVRYIDGKQIVFSLPPHNAKQSHSIYGNIGDDVDIALLKKSLHPFLVKFTEEEEIQLRRTNVHYGDIPFSATVKNEPTTIIEQDQSQTIDDITPTKQTTQQRPPVIYKLPPGALTTNRGVKRPIDETTMDSVMDLTMDSQPLQKRQADYIPISNQFQNNYTSSDYQTDSFNMVHNYGYKVPTNQMLQMDTEIDDFFTQSPMGYDINDQVENYQGPLAPTTNIEDKIAYAKNILSNIENLYEPSFFEGDISDNALQILREAQIIYHEIYPESFTQIVLPGNSHQIIQNIDPDAVMMAPKQFRRFMKRRLVLTELRERGMIKKRTQGILYPTRSDHAKNRPRVGLGLFSAK